jgi:hypothetical protein
MYVDKYKFNPLSNKIFIGFSRCILGYFAGISLNISGYYIISNKVVNW